MTTEGKKVDFIHLDTVDTIVAAIKMGDFMLVDKNLSQGEGNNIPVVRNRIKEVISSEQLNNEEFWKFLLHILKFNRRIYRKPITEAIESFRNISNYNCCSSPLFEGIAHIMLEDADKILDALRFLKTFKANIPSSLLEKIYNSAEYINQPEGFSYLFEILDLSTEDKLNLACKIATPAALYSLYLELLRAEEMFGIWHIQGLSNFPDRLLELPDNFDTQLILDLIERNVFHEDINDSKGHLEDIDKNGYEAFYRLSYRQKARNEHRRNIKKIGTLVGKTVTCRVVAKYKRHYLMQATSGLAVCGLIPISLTYNEYSIGDTASCNVVGIIKGQNLLLLTQKPCKKSFIEKIPVVLVGEIYEARFCLYNKTILPEILGCGPVRATLKSIPRNFEYKKHHKVRVVSSKLATCEIEIIGKV